jgi:pilus assembly protein CpaC
MFLIALYTLMLCNLNAFDKLESVSTLYVGDSLRIDGSRISKVNVSNSRVLKVTKENGSTLLLNAKSRGNATLHVWYKGGGEPSKYSFTVMAANVYRRLSEVRSALKDVKGIKIYAAGEKIYLTGVVGSPTDMELIGRLSSSEKDIVNYTKLSDNVIYGEYSKLADSLFELGLYDVNIKKVESSLFLDAVARTKTQMENAEYYIKSNYPNSRFDIKIVPYQIDIDVKIVEINDSESRNMGLDVPSEFALSRHTVLSMLEVDSILHLSEGKSSAKIVSNPSLSSNDGELAAFHVGGAIPIRMSTRYSSTLDWKNYGVILNFTPKVINEDTVELSISTEFSSIDDSVLGSNNNNNNNNSIPSFLVREVRTIVTLEAGKSVVISGLVSKNISKANRGLPAISNIPVLSDFFSANDDTSDSTELVVIVTPMIRFRVGDLYIDKKLERMLAEVLSEEVK